MRYKKNHWRKNSKTVNDKISSSRGNLNRSNSSRAARVGVTREGANRSGTTWAGETWAETARVGSTRQKQAGLPHGQGTQGIFKLKKIPGKLREIQGISGNFDLFFKLTEVLTFSKKFREVLKISRYFFAVFRIRVNLIKYFVQEFNFI